MSNFVGIKELKKIIATIELGVRGNPDFTVSKDALQQLLIAAKMATKNARQRKPIK